MIQATNAVYRLEEKVNTNDSSHKYGLSIGIESGH